MVLSSKTLHAQKKICAKYNAEFCLCPDDLKVGVALNVKENLAPINGLRHPLEGDTTGWYIWAGEKFSYDPDFFKPLHIKHLPEWCPQIMKYLGLPPGWRFLIDTGKEYEDVWYDKSLL